jgi:hypothetical protein
MIMAGIPGKKTFGMADIDDFEELNMLDERKQTREAALGDSIHEFMYEYDFGDSWRHRIAVKPVARPNTNWHYPLCTGGARAAPPDDVGGPPGYQDSLQRSKTPNTRNTTAGLSGSAVPSIRRVSTSMASIARCTSAHRPLTPRATVGIQARWPRWAMR